MAIYGCEYAAAVSGANLYLTLFLTKDGVTMLGTSTYVSNIALRQQDGTLLGSIVPTALANDTDGRIDIVVTGASASLARRAPFYFHADATFEGDGPHGISKFLSYL